MKENSYLKVIRANDEMAYIKSFLARCDLYEYWSMINKDTKIRVYIYDDHRICIIRSSINEMKNIKSIYVVKKIIHQQTKLRPANIARAFRGIYNVNPVFIEDEYNWDQFHEKFKHKLNIKKIN